MPTPNPSETESAADSISADEILLEDLYRQRAKEDRRAKLMAKVAKLRMTLARTHHRTENGEKMDLEEYPYLKEILLCPAQDLTIMGSVQGGKTEVGIIDDIARSLCGLKVFHICESSQKRDKFVLGRLDPTIHSVEIYKKSLEAAAMKAGGEGVDSARFKHFGDGHINFIGSNTPSDFYGHPADSIAIDDHQRCNQENLRLAFNRTSASDWQFVTRNGNPQNIGTPENENIDWHFKQGDMRHWNVPCPHCGKYQVLGWWSHFINEQTNEFGAITEISVRDESWNEKSASDFRPICENCTRPMVRLSRDGKWVPLHPGRFKVSFHLSGLFNPKASMSKLLEHYRGSIMDPVKRSEFVNNQLGLPYDHSGSSITEDMLVKVSTGAPAGIPPYRFVHSNELVWRQIDL